MNDPARPGPLAGVRVADFTWVWAGPFCTLQLAHLGAEVIRVESATRLCVTRLIPPFADGTPGIDRSGYFNQYNQGKKSLALDLKQPDALEIARRLVAASDVVVDNFAAGVMERLGLGYEALCAVKRDIIAISLSGYGQTGPQRDYVSYGPAQVPLSGMSSVTGYAGWPPMHVGISYGDPTAGLHAAFAVLCALLHRDRTGGGQMIDLSQWETSMTVLPEAILDFTMNGREPPRAGNRDPHMAPHGVFRCAGTDRWVAIAVEDEAQWHALCAVLDRPELADDERFATLAARKTNEEELEALVTAWTSRHAPEEVTARLQARGVAAFPSMTNADLSADPHLGARGFFVTLDHPVVGRRQHIGVPWRTSDTPSVVRRAAPCLGQDTDEVMTALLGYSAREVTELRARGVLE
jgi:benzylsuccinate CoA-transferase BbsF subunit